MHHRCRPELRSNASQHHTELKAGSQDENSCTDGISHHRTSAMEPILALDRAEPVQRASCSVPPRLPKEERRPASLAALLAGTGLVSHYAHRRHRGLRAVGGLGIGFPLPSWRGRASSESSRAGRRARPPKTHDSRPDGQNVQPRQFSWARRHCSSSASSCLGMCRVLFGRWWALTWAPAIRSWQPWKRPLRPSSPTRRRGQARGVRRS